MADYDASDPNSDPFKPPAISTLVSCLHCGEEYDSYLIEWREETDANGRKSGFWCCPTPGCGGAGFGCDIFPIDPDYVDEDGNKMWSFDDEDEELDELEELDDEVPSDDIADDDDEAIPF